MTYYEQVKMSQYDQNKLATEGELDEAVGNDEAASCSATNCKTCK